MNILLWVLQVALAFLYISGGAYKVIKVDSLKNHLSYMPPIGWKAIGLIEVVGGILLVIPAGVTGMPSLIALAATVLAAEGLMLTLMYAQRSLKLVAQNPLVFAAPMTVLVAFVAYARYALV